MGVIDLDARVKKLEQADTSSEIDQIEADLTALENAVGDLIEDVSDKITFNTELDFAEGFPKISIMRIGNMTKVYRKRNVPNFRQLLGICKERLQLQIPIGNYRGLLRLPQIRRKLLA